jgi:hypothetical protein
MGKPHYPNWIWLISRGQDRFTQKAIHCTSHSLAKHRLAKPMSLSPDPKTEIVKVVTNKVGNDAHPTQVGIAERLTRKTIHGQQRLHRDGSPDGSS